MDIREVKLEIIDRVLKTEDTSLLPKLLKILNGEHVLLDEERKDRVNDLGDSYVLKGTDLEEKKKILREALEEGENSGMVEDFDLESFLKELHREHL